MVPEQLKPSIYSVLSEFSQAPELVINGIFPAPRKLEKAGKKKIHRVWYQF